MTGKNGTKKSMAKNKTGNSPGRLSENFPEQEQRQRLEYLGIVDQDKKNVRGLQDTFSAHAHEFAENFYQRLLSNPHTASFLRDPVKLEELKSLQIRYFSGLLQGILDGEYFESRLRVGRAHQKVGLEPVWYLGAYNQYIQLTFPQFARAFGPEAEKALEPLLSLVKIIFLDLGLALDTYFQQATEKIRQRNQELQQALALYWQAQRREEQMRKLISHEVRGGLAAVITTLEDLLDTAGTALQPTGAEMVQNINRRCWSLSNLLKEMLSAREGGGPTWVETAQIFENLLGRFGLYAEGRSVHLSLPQNPPRVWADPIHLREVFANLLANAVRYMNKDEGRIEITCRPEGPHYLFVVADNGPGIPQEIRERLFEPFVRGPARDGKPEGTGLGLYFVRTVIEQGGGKVGVENIPGEGSRFWFTVPRTPPSPKMDNETLTHSHRVQT